MPEHIKSYDYILNRINKTLVAVNNHFPQYTENGRWYCTRDVRWTAGFWVGILWMAYILTNDNKYRDHALSALPSIENGIYSKDTSFDLGFLIVPSFVAGYGILNDARLRSVAFKGAERMTEFYHKKAGLIYTVYPKRQGINGKIGSSIIDILMNLSLLWWAAVETGIDTYHEIAYRHAKVASELLVRHNYSAYQIIDFKVDDGRVERKGNIHGYNNESTWSRGIAWAVYGFTVAYKYTGEKYFRELSENMAQYFVSKLPKDSISYWDLDDPGIPQATRDSSASAIAANAMLLMGNEWKNRGEMILEDLHKVCLTNQLEQGILPMATAYKRYGKGIEQGTIWGDYFFVRGLLFNGDLVGVDI